MLNQFSRTELLIKKEGIEKLKNSKILIFGVGGVGGYALEALTRSGVYNIDIVDNDKISLTNINRQIIALHSTIGEYKVDVAKRRMLDINPDAHINAFKMFYLPETKQEFDFKSYDYIIDAVDTIKAKLSIIEEATNAGVPVISAMGAGNKLDPTMFEVADISKTSVCPLARVIRTELKKKKIKNVKVVYSKEIPIKQDNSVEYTASNHPVPASIATCPSAMGLIMASVVIRDLINN